jgi:hypothetical protein
MNNKYVNWIFVLFVITGMISCTKDKDALNGNKLVMSVQSGCEFDIFLFCEDIPVYYDTTMFRQVYECLNDEYETWNNEFEETYAHLNDDDLETIIIQTGFSEEHTLQTFEEAIGYNSYRTHLSSLEQNWIDAGMDDNTDPDNVNPLDDPVLETMLNWRLECFIGNMYMKYIYEDWLLLMNPSCDQIDSARLGIYTPTNLPNNGMMLRGGDDDDCVQRKVKGGSYPPDPDDYKLKWKHGLRDYPWGSRFFAKTRSFKKKSNGTWKKHKTTIGVNIRGELWNVTCDQSANIGTIFGKEVRRKNVTTGRTDWGRILKIQRDELYSDHWIKNLLNCQKYLTW